MENKCVVIVGMHRSGTSLTSSILEKAGLNIGERLLGEGVGNVEGHFENLDFFNFQCKILSEQGFHQDGWSNQSVPFLEQYREEAEAIIKNNEAPMWGWKDPRTCLFLDFWDKLLPDACYLFVYRSPWGVVDSLYRRGTDDAIKEDYQIAVNSWLAYNEYVLSFYNKNKEKGILIDIEDVKADIPSFITKLNSKFNLTLNTAFESPIKEQLFEKKGDLSLLKRFFPELDDLYGRLNMASGSQKAQKDSPEEGVKELLLEFWGASRLNKAKVKAKAKEHKKERDALNEIIKNKEQELAIAAERIAKLELEFSFRLKRKIKQLFLNR